MPGYTPKTEDQLQWDLIKAAARAKVNVEVADYRNRRLNAILSELWPAYRAQLSGEVMLELEPEYETWVRDATEASREATRV